MKQFSILIFFRLATLFLMLTIIVSIANAESEKLTINYYTNLSDTSTLASIANHMGSAPVTLIGTTHDLDNEHYTRDFLFAIKPHFPDLKCLLWEFSDRHAENMASASVDNWGAFERQFYRLDMEVSRLFGNTLGFYPSNQLMRPIYIKKLVEYGYINIPIDFSYTDIEWLENAKAMLSKQHNEREYLRDLDTLFINQRNQHFYETIVEKLNNGCDQLAFIVGVDHLQNDLNYPASGVRTPSLQSYFQETEVSVIEVDKTDFGVTPYKVIKNEILNTQEIAKNMTLSPEQLESLELANQDWIPRLQDLSLFNENDFYPDERNADFIDDDFFHQRGVQILMKEGHFKRKSLIICDTGHCIPIAAQLMAEPNYRMIPIFQFPASLRDQGKRLFQQGQVWASDIGSSSKLQSSVTETNAIFISLEAHRRKYSIPSQTQGDFIYELNTNQLPNQEQLIELGIEQVVYIFEDHPLSTDVERKTLRDIRRYIETIQLPKKYLGADCRRGGGC